MSVSPHVTGFKFYWYMHLLFFKDLFIKYWTQCWSNKSVPQIGSFKTCDQMRITIPSYGWLSRTRLYRCQLLGFNFYNKHRCVEPAKKLDEFFFLKQETRHSHTQLATRNKKLTTFIRFKSTISIALSMLQGRGDRSCYVGRYSRMASSLCSSSQNWRCRGFEKKVWRVCRHEQEWAGLSIHCIYQSDWGTQLYLLFI